MAPSEISEGTLIVSRVEEKRNDFVSIEKAFLSREVVPSRPSISSFEHASRSIAKLNDSV